MEQLFKEYGSDKHGEIDGMFEVKYKKVGCGIRRKGVGGFDCWKQ